MNLKRVLYGAAGLMLASAVAFAGQADPKIDKMKNPAAFTETAPATYKVKFDTSKGPFVVTVHRDWAPLGADRLFNLVKAGFYDDVRFFRVIPGFMAQFGIHGRPSVMEAWRPARIVLDAGRTMRSSRATCAATSRSRPPVRTRVPPNCS